MYQEILYGLAFVVLCAASYSDIKKREVADWINYGLIFSALCLRGIYSLYLSDYMIIVYGLLGFGVMFLLACAMFYTGQWGGGDSKLLMGLGAVFGLGWDYRLLVFLIGLVFVGSLYGLAWTFILFVKNWSKSKQEFLSILSAKRAMQLRVPAYGFSVLFLIMAYFIVELRYMLVVLALFLPLMFYTWIYTKVVENVAMLKKVSPSVVTEGDWIAKDVMYKGKRLCGPKDLGISKKKLAILQELHKRGKIDKVVVKYGIPFVPSFLLAFIATLVVGGWVLILF